MEILYKKRIQKKVQIFNYKFIIVIGIFLDLFNRYLGVEFRRVVRVGDIYIDLKFIGIKVIFELIGEDMNMYVNWRRNEESEDIEF